MENLPRIVLAHAGGSGRTLEKAPVGTAQRRLPQIQPTSRARSSPTSRAKSSHCHPERPSAARESKDLHFKCSINRHNWVPQVSLLRPGILDAEKLNGNARSVRARLHSLLKKARASEFCIRARVYSCRNCPIFDSGLQPLLRFAHSAAPCVFSQHLQPAHKLPGEEVEARASS